METNRVQKMSTMDGLWRLRLLVSRLMLPCLLKLNSRLTVIPAGLLVGLASLQLVSGSVHAGAAAGGASEVTQIINMTQLIMSYAQQVESYQNQLMQYSTMVQNLKANPDGVRAPNLLQLSANAARIMSVGQDIASSMNKVDTNFASTFNNPTAASYGAKFGLWTNASKDSLKAAMLNAGLQREQFADDSSALQAMTASVAKSDGNLAALQALGSLNAAQVQESMKLRDLISQQQVAQNTFLAAQTSKDQAKLENNRAIMGAGNKPMPDASSYQ